jgi:membrane-associated protease RseP (regulator of RpoE activity)
MLRNALVAAAVLLGLALFLDALLTPFLARLRVDQEVTRVLADLLIAVVPVAVYVTIGVTARSLRPGRLLYGLLLTAAGVSLAFAVITFAQSLSAASGTEGANQKPSLQMSLSQGEEGILVEAVEAGGSAERAGVQVGDIITAIRRDDVDLAVLNQRVLEAEGDTPFRLRILRDGEEIQLTVRSSLVATEAVSFDLQGLLVAWGGAVLSGLVGLLGPARLTPSPTGHRGCCQSTARTSLAA